MPIQPMNITNHYERIPDEDVTPMPRLISNTMKKSTKYIIITCSALLVFIVFMFFTWDYYSSRSTVVKIYQTTMKNKNNMYEVLLSDLRGVISDNIHSLSFGNTKCDAVQCNDLPINTARLYVDANVKYQKIIGFGGAFTEATAINFYKLPQIIQNKVIQLYFGIEGIGLTLGRIAINSCDFALKSYSFDEIEGDYDLLYFDSEVTHDNAYILPLLRLAMSVSLLPIKLLASPWSPPAWMKNSVNNSASMTGSATPNGLKDDPNVKLSWAKYIAKFITAYESKGVPIWGVTPQNEPEFAAPWEACAYTASYEKDFIENYLGPVLRIEHPNVVLLGFDHNKDHLELWTRTLISGETKKFVDGMAFHWYSGYDRISDGTYGYDAINASHHYAPNAIMIASEGCSCPNVDLNNWLRAERLGHDIMFDLQNYAQGWIDWNLLVDFQGGPNHLNNFCDASLIANKQFSDVFIQPKFYYMGHFSKYVLPGDARVESSIIGDYGFKEMDPNIQAGLELGMFKCEKSVRQIWTLHGPTETLRLATPALTQDITYDGKVMLCVVQGDIDRPVLHIADCSDVRPATKFLKVIINDYGQLQDRETGLCISFKGDVREPGALLELTSCIHNNINNNKNNNILDHQIFVINSFTGEITSPKVDRDLCLTVGWPFLTTIAFKSLETSKTTVIIMNEASIYTSIALYDESRSEYIGFGIHERSIQTIIY